MKTKTAEEEAAAIKKAAATKKTASREQQIKTSRGSAASAGLRGGKPVSEQEGGGGGGVRFADDGEHAPGGENVRITVVAKDTLSQLAIVHGVTVDAIVAANEEIKSADDIITVGQELFIPQPPTSMNEGVASEFGHIVLDIVGLIPAAGEAADIVNAIWYIGEAEKRRKEGDGYEAAFAYLFAALSVVSLAGSVAPIVGDLVPKGVKYTAQAGRLVAFMAKSGKQARALKTKLHVEKPKIDNIIKQSGSKDERLEAGAPYMLAALAMFAGGRMPVAGSGTESLDAEARRVGGETEVPEEETMAVLDLDSEKGPEQTVAELRKYIMNIINNG